MESPGSVFVAGDEVYGDGSKLRSALEEQYVGYVLAVSCNHQVRTATGKHCVDQLADLLPARAWQQRSAGQGAKGPRLYDWALVQILPDTVADDTPPGHWWLLIRRNRKLASWPTSVVTHRNW